jgi:hypothetical protein
MRKRSNTPLNLLLVSSALLVSACATTAPTGGVQTREVRTTGGMPVKITRIPLPGLIHKDVQVAAGSVWAYAPGMFSPITFRIDPNSNQVVELSSPFTATGADLLVDEHAMWLSEAQTPMAGRGDLRRIDLASNQTVATIEAVGAPFATDDDTVWAYNPFTGVVTGIDIKDNRIRTKIATKGRVYLESVTFGAGSLWQFAFKGNVTSSQVARRVFPPGMVRRIDPQSGKVVAEIPLGPYRPSDRINFVAGAIWVVGERDDSGLAVATRIDVATNRVAATIRLPRQYGCVVQRNPRTPVLWKGAIWLSTFCTDIGHMPGLLLKIDLEKNEVTDQLGLSQSQGHLGRQPDLAAGEGAVWGFDGRSALRFDF